MAKIKNHMDSLIRTDHLSRVYQSGDTHIKALSDVSVKIMPGKLTLLRGRSGSGKTTLMNLLGALDMTTDGQVYFDGEDITSLSESKRDILRRDSIGFVFQSIALVTQMSAYENVELNLRVAKYNAKERRKRAEECLSLVGLSKRMHHRPGELSGGEQQRVAIARAIAHKPKVIFADEPTAELDTHLGLQVVKLFRDLVMSEDVTIVMTTHDPNMMELADHVYTLEDGQIVEEFFGGDIKGGDSP